MATSVQLQGAFGYGVQADADTASSTVSSYPVTSANIGFEPVWSYWEGPGAYDTEAAAKHGWDYNFSVEGWIFDTNFSDFTTFAIASDPESPTYWSIGVSGVDGVRTIHGALCNSFSVNWANRDVVTFSMDGIARSGTSGLTGPTQSLPSELTATSFKDWTWTIGGFAVPIKEATFTVNNNVQLVHDMGTTTDQTKLFHGRREYSFSCVIDADADDSIVTALNASTVAGSLVTVTGTGTGLGLAIPKLIVTNSVYQGISGSTDRMEISLEGRALVSASGDTPSFS